MKHLPTITTIPQRYDKSFKSIHFYLKQTSKKDTLTAVIVAVTFSDSNRNSNPVINPDSNRNLSPVRQPDSNQSIEPKGSPARIRVYSHLKVEPAFWDKRTQCCIDSELVSPRVRVRTERINKALEAILIAIRKEDMVQAERGQFLDTDLIRSVIDRSVEPFIIHKPTFSPQSPHVNTQRTPLQSSATSFQQSLVQSAPPPPSSLTVPSPQLPSAIQPLPPTSNQPFLQNNHPTPLSILQYLAKTDTKARGGLTTAAETTHKAYAGACRRVDMFLKESEFRVGTLADFGREFFVAFRGWLMRYRFRRGGAEIGYTASTIAATLGIVRTLLQKAEREGYAVNGYYKTVTVEMQSSDKIYLTEGELARLSRVEVDTDVERGVRDMFMLASFTALRISDINRLNLAEIDDATIKMFQKKTGGDVKIPILKEVAGLVRQYKSQGFPRLCDGYANKTIRKLAERAGLDTQVSVRVCRGGVASVTRLPKSSLISFHTARRSCITNLFLRGYSINCLMSLSGHSSIQSFQRYVRSSSDDLTRAFLDELRRRGDL